MLTDKQLGMKIIVVTLAAPEMLEPKFSLITLNSGHRFCKEKIKKTLFLFFIGQMPLTILIFVVVLF
jgi:hypothetical protein